MRTVLVIDDERTVHAIISSALKSSDVDVVAVNSGVEGLRCVENDQPDVVLLDYHIPPMTGLEVFEQIRRLDAKLPVIFITSSDDADLVIEAIRQGAYDYLHKPLDVSHLRTLVNQALEHRRLMCVPVTVAESDTASVEGELLVGSSPRMLEVYKEIGRVAPTNVPVLIRGESGTGKELVARAIYQFSKRCDRPFVAVNCAALPDHLLETELFGHEKGAFTDAVNRRIGKFEQCSGGTVLLDEVGDMPLKAQSKMLRLLQEQQFERVGGNETITVDVRIISATNQNLEELIKAKEFRSDLFFRLNGFTIRLPPLLDRPGDVVLLLKHYLTRYSQELGKDVEGVSPDAWELLTRYDWPGNVRQLQNAIRQALLHAKGTLLMTECLPPEISGHSNEIGELSRDSKRDSSMPVDLSTFVNSRIQVGSERVHAETMEMVERYLISRILNETNGNQSQASRLLGISRKGLRQKMQSLGITINQKTSVESDISDGDSAGV